MALTELWLKSQLNKPREQVEEHADRDAMSVRISKKGKIVFQYRYRYAGKAHRLDLGSYPLMSLKQARQQLDEYRTELEKGNNPKQIKLERREKQRTAYTFKQLFDEWFDKSCILKKKPNEIRRTFELYVLPVLGEQLSDKITIAQWMNLLDEIKQSKPYIAKRILINANQAMNWGVKRELIDKNVLANVSAHNDLHIQDRMKDRVLDDREIYMVLYALKNSNINYRNELLLRLLLIYGCRIGELRLAKKEDFDFDNHVWTVPATNHKTGLRTKKPIKRPITPTIKPYIEQAMALNDSPYLFTTPDNTILIETTHLKIPNCVIHWLDVNKGIKMQHWSVHDLRRTMRTNMSAHVPPHVCEIMLGHKLPVVWATYDKYDYLDEQAQAYEAWAVKIKEIELDTSFEW
jgi:integrase